MRDKCVPSPRITPVGRFMPAYGDNILGVRAAIPAMLALFREYQVRVTWAAVGMLLFDSKKDLLKYLPERRPRYADLRHSPYPGLDEIGETEARDPFHYGLSLARQILDCDGMELGSHTFSHYYCLERGQDVSDFRSDLEASIAASQRLGVRPVSLIFPRNQYNPEYLSVCAEAGFRTFRGNQRNWMYRGVSENQQSKLARAARLADNYFDLSGDNSFTPELTGGLWNLPASRFLRPFSKICRKLDGFRLARIRNSMTTAAKSGNYYHLWWHPHNFGTNLNENLAILTQILRHYATLRDRYGMVPMTMGEAIAE